MLVVLATMLFVSNQVNAQEPYAVLSDDNTVLTFYYDGNKGSRNGMDVGPFTYSYETYTPNTSWYAQRKNITTVVFDDSFADCTAITSTKYWFYECKNLTTITGISNLKTENVTDMYAMFDNCSSLTSIDVSRFNTEKVTDMGWMFEGCSSLTSLDLSGFNTEKVTYMNGMFCVCSSLTSLDVSGFNTEKVSSMNNLFTFCSSLTSLDVSGFNTENVTGMYSMFGGCSSLTSLDVSGFNTENVTSMSKLFSGCSALTTIYADEAKWSTASVIGSEDIFSGCTALVGGNGTAYDAGHVYTEYARIDKAGQPGYLTQKTAMGIQTMATDKGVNASAPVYNLNGHRLTAPQKGLNIVGSKKVLVK